MSIKLEKVTAGYGNFFKMEDIDFQLEEGSFTGIIGPNGSGKSTLLKIMAGIIRPESGQVKIKGEDIQVMKPGKRSRLISFLPPNSPADFPFTVLETVLMGRNPYLQKFSGPSKEDREKAFSAIEKTGIKNLAGRPVVSLSSGERQRVMLARAICQEAEVMLLDEPASHLDVHHRNDIFRLLREINRAGVTIAAVLHEINLVPAYCSRAAVVKGGKLYLKGGKSDEVINKRFLENVYGGDIRVEEVKGKRFILP